MSLGQWLAATVMSKETCAVLAGVFPLVLLTAVLERRSIHLNIRRKVWFRWSTQAIVTSSALGLGLAIVGVQTNGLALLAGCVAWVGAATAVVGLLWTLLAALATAESDEDRDLSAPDTH